MSGRTGRGGDGGGAGAGPGTEPGSEAGGESEGEPGSGGGVPDGVCVLTHPLGAAGENATRTLLAVLSAVTAVSLVTADLPSGSAIRGEHEVVEISRQGTGASVPVAAYRFLRNQVRMARTVRRREEEVALFFGATAYLLPVLAARAAGKTVVVEPRGDVPLTLRLSWERRLPSPVARLLAGSVRALERLNYRLADAVVAYTPSMAAELGLDRYAGKLYANGARYVDTERFRPTTPFAERGPVVGFVGRLDEEKNVRALAAAAAGLPDGVTFRFVGDGPLRAALEREFAAAVADGRIEFVGWVDHDDVPAQLNRLRLLVLPSQPTEGLPTTILESMACGTPALASPVSGVPDAVREGETGFHLTDRGPAAIRDRIVSILGRGPDAPPGQNTNAKTDPQPDLTAVSARARTLAVEEYSFAAAVDRYRRILTALPAGSG